MALSDFVTERGERFALERGSDPSSGMIIDRCDPEFQKLFADFVINGMYAREVLPQSVRELMAVACLTALHRSAELEHHIRCAVRLNASEQVMETILLAGLYGGFPSMINGLRILASIDPEKETERSVPTNNP